MKRYKFLVLCLQTSGLKVRVLGILHVTESWMTFIDRNISNVLQQTTQFLQLPGKQR